MSQHPPHGTLPADFKPRSVVLQPHRYSIACDFKGCSARSPETEAIDFDIGGEKAARAIAEGNGWIRVKIESGWQDVCPEHRPQWTRTRDGWERVQR